MTTLERLSVHIEAMSDDHKRRSVHCGLIIEAKAEIERLEKEKNDLLIVAQFQTDELKKQLDSARMKLQRLQHHENQTTNPIRN